MGIGDWGLGIGDWAWGLGPNPQSPIPNPHFLFFILINLNYLISTSILFYKYQKKFNLVKNKYTKNIY
jgi:hypothetical protein